MKIFDDSGMMIIPEGRKNTPGKTPITLAVTSCRCQAGHQLIDPRASFGGLPGIVLKVSAHGREGLVALSSVFGDKTVFTFDLTLEDGEEMALACPHCGVSLPIYGPCECGSEFVALFTGALGDFADSIGICRRVGCPMAHLVQSGEMVAQSTSDAL